MSLQIFVTLAALVTLASAQAPLTVNTPSSAQACLPVAISWTGGTPPVYVSLIPGGQAGGAIVQDFGPQTDSSLTWDVNQPAGTSLTVQIRDSKGVLNYSDKFQVQPSTQTCKTGEPGKTPTTPAPGGNTTPAPGGNTTKPSTPTTPTTPGTPTNTAPGSASTGTTTSPPGGSNTTPTTPGTPSNGSTGGASGGASSDASQVIPGFFALALAGAISVFA